MTISIIIRVKNEEKWIEKCLKSIFDQNVNHNIEVIIVDNNSTDFTIGIAKRYPIKKVVKITNFLPGKAINQGIRVSSGDYIVCISAHCIPEKNDWLNNLLCNFKTNHKIAGVYGRQLPMTFTEPIDKRDLMIVFGLDKRIQEKDYFFHNANSMIPRSIWEKFPFDETVTNIEDRVWGKQVIEAGYKIIYEPKAAVFHHHGLHQGNIKSRAKGVVSILEKVDSKFMSGLPNNMLPKSINVVAVIPIKGKGNLNDIEIKQLKKLLNQIKKSKFINTIYCLTHNKKLIKDEEIITLDKGLIENSNSIGLDKLMMETLFIIEKLNDFPDSFIYINYDYCNRPKDIFDKLIIYAQRNGCDTVFPGLVDYGHYWYLKDEDYKQTDPSLKLREKREPIYKALYGLGCISSSWIVRSGKLVGGKIGILKIKNSIYSHRNKQND